MKTSVSAFILVALCIVTFAPDYAQGATFLTTTISDIGRPYTVIDGGCVYQQFPGFSFSGDPLQTSVDKAFQKMADRAKQLGADALVGFDIDFNSRPMKGEEGRVLLCGTLVKLKK